MCKVNRELASIDSSQNAVNQFADFPGNGLIAEPNACGGSDTHDKLARCSVAQAE
jgi:hypothetical protein